MIPTSIKTPTYGFWTKNPRVAGLRLALCRHLFSMILACLATGSGWFRAVPNAEHYRKSTNIGVRLCATYLGNICSKSGTHRQRRKTIKWMAIQTIGHINTLALKLGTSKYHKNTPSWRRSTKTSFQTDMAHVLVVACYRELKVLIFLIRTCSQDSAEKSHTHPLMSVFCQKHLRRVPL